MRKSKRMMSLILTVVLAFMALGFTAAADAESQDKNSYIAIGAYDFGKCGTWEKQSGFDGAFEGINLFSGIEGGYSGFVPAETEVDVPAEDSYEVWARSFDFDDDAGDRTFRVGVNGNSLTTSLGAHGSGRWKWEKAGTVSLNKGAARLSLIAENNYARVDYILITNDAQYVPQDMWQQFSKSCGITRTADTASVYENVQTTGELPAFSGGGSRYSYHCFSADMFDKGGWNYSESTPGAYQKGALEAQPWSSVSAGASPKVTFEAESDGRYLVWCHTRDYTDRPASRTFKVKVNGVVTDKLFGTHMIDDWQWECSSLFDVKKGTNTLELAAQAQYARCDLFIVTNDEEFEPVNDMNLLEKKLRTPAVRSTTDEIGMKWNGETLYLNTKPYLKNGRIMLAAKEIYGMFGAEPVLSETDGLITVNTGGKDIKCRLGWEEGYIDGVCSLMGAAPEVKGGVLYMPLRFAANSMDAKVRWLENSNTALIITQDAEEKRTDIFIRPDSFYELGTWSAGTNDGALGGYNLIGNMTDGVNPSDTAPAKAKFEIAEEDSYYIWVRSRDFGAAQRPGARFSELAIDGVKSAKQIGKHGKDGWKWELIDTKKLTVGEHQLSLIDASAFWPRVDGIYITSDKALTPPETLAELTALAQPIKAVEQETEFPAWAAEQGKILQTVTLENDCYKAEFYIMERDGKSYVKSEQYIMDNGQWSKTFDRLNNFGYYLLYAKDSHISGLMENYPVWNSKYEVNGQEVSSSTGNVFESAAAAWIVPSRVDGGGNSVTLTGENDYASLAVTWELVQGMTEPKVTTKLTPKVDGQFSLGVSNGAAVTKDDVDFILAPYFLYNMILPKEPYVVTEAVSSTGTSSVSVTRDGKKYTYSMTAEPSEIEHRWATTENSKYGFTLLNNNGGVQPWMFSPLLGTEHSTLKAGETFSMSYRPTVLQGDWQDGYMHVVKDIYGLNGYRKNYKQSLSNQTFHITNLLEDDFYGGWDKEGKANWNIEGQNVSTNGDPLSYLQMYLLTEDESLLENRTIPTIENLLTRGNQHFTYNGKTGDGTVLKEQNGTPTPLSGPISMFGVPVFSGADAMTFGTAPILEKISYGDGVRPTENSNIPSFVDTIWAYKYTGDEELLEKAKQQADEYLESKVYARKDTNNIFLSFIAMSYYPQFSALLDMYEITGEQKYLDAAQYSANLALTTIWTQPMPADKEVTIKGSEVVDAHAKLNMWHYGSDPFRIGFDVKDGKREIKEVPDQTVPEWVVSRVGLSLEQGTTFINVKYANIMMTNWAPDFIRLTEYTGDPIYEAYARNSTVGRGENYPGYYYNAYQPHFFEENYPYEGPDFSSLYYHHIPIHLSNLQDYLITQAWAWSDKQIEFPHTRTYGYVWFYNRHYGQEPGHFYDIDGMWPYLKEGAVETNHLQLDWLGARKDGVFGFAVMNEDTQEITSDITISEELLPQGSAEAVVYDAQGNKSSAQITDGKIRLTVPARGIVSVSFESGAVTEPRFAEVFRAAESGDPALTYAEETDDANLGAGTVLKFDPDKWYAYIYTAKSTDFASSVTLRYRVDDGKWQTVSDNLYPFEFTVPVENGERIEFNMEINKTLGGTLKTPTKSLQPIK